MIRIFLLAWSATTALAAPASPLAESEKYWLNQGYSVKERAQRPAGRPSLAAVVYAGSNADALEAYVVNRDRAFLAYSHPSSVERLVLAGPRERRWTDLLGDGSRALAYRAALPSLGSATLRVLRFKDLKVSVAGEFPEGELHVDGAGVLVVAKDLPLGRFASVGCEDYGTTAKDAYRTRLYSPVKGAFREVTASRPAFFEAEIARKEGELTRLGEDLDKHAGAFAGLAISAYYDYAALGRAREGWEKLRSSFKLPAFAPSSARSCLAAMTRDLEARLDPPSR